MGLDTTIKSRDGLPLGNAETVKSAIAAAFPGVKFGVLPSGVEKIRVMAERGIEFPEVIRAHLESQPAELGGDFQNDQFSAEFFLGSTEPIEHVDAVLRGQTVASEPFLEKLMAMTGWQITHP